MKITIDELQAYLTDHYGGRANEQGMFMKLVEEMGETAEILNMRAGRKTDDGSDLNYRLGVELADIIHYAMAIAAINGINMNDVIIEKDKSAAVKYKHRTNLEDFVRARRETLPQEKE